MAQITLNSTGVASNGILSLQSNGTTSAITIDASQNVGLGVAPSAWGTLLPALQLGGGGAFISGRSTNPELYVGTNSHFNGTAYIYKTSNVATLYAQDTGAHVWYKAASGTAGNTITFSQAMTLDATGQLLVGSTVTGDGRIKSDATTGSSIACAVWAKNNAGASSGTYVGWNAATTGNNSFMDFYTETTSALRGSITYNRAGGLTTYNTTSDYRAKDISGPVTGSGALIDSTPVYMGKMKGATQERPMFIAHETPSYAHTGEKDAVDKDGKPVYQQMDASALIPIMWAEIQSLRQRLAAANL
jgi:hypothetical protein